MSVRAYNIIIVVLIVLACSIAAGLLYLIYDSAVAPEPIPSPTPLPTQESLLPEDAWARVQTTGTLIVGTSADYPPFAYYTDDFQLTGLDIALSREMATRLGVEVDIRDMAFDGINWALELGEIDVAIAALSVTPERSASMDFSDVYFVSEDAIMARINAPIPLVTNVDQLAGYRIGVQQATVYSNWIYESLIDTGLMPASQLQTYEQIELAVRDLREGLIDIVVLDLPPAEVAIAQGGVKLVGQGLNTQHYAIGIPKGEEALRTQMNAALAQMVADGTLAQLVQTYMGIAPPPLPTPTPTAVPGQPTATPVATATPAPCVDGMRFIADLNLDDKNMTAPPIMPPGQAFRKGWRVRNTGTCTWDSLYALTYAGGNSPAASMGGQPTFIAGTVPPGAEYDIFVNLVAPVSPGVYQGFWVMRNGQGKEFGDRIWVGITVPAPSTATPPPTQTPSPGISFTVDRNQIFAGECVDFTWNVTNVQAVYFYQQGQPWQQHQVASQGTSRQCPPVTTTYYLRVVKPDNTVEIREITIFVSPVPGAPIIDRFTVEPGQVVLGNCVDIVWAVQGNVTRIRLLRGQGVLWDGAPVSGTLQDCPSVAGQLTYTIEALGPGGTSRLQRQVAVVPPTLTPTRPIIITPSPTSPTVTPTVVTPTPIPPPVIQSFTVNPAQIEVGQCVLGSWQVSGGVSRIQLRRDGVIILDNAPFTGTAQDCLSTAGSHTYSLQASGLAGETVSAEQVVAVTEPSSGLPLENTTWFLESYYDGVGAPVALLPGTSVTAIFGADGQLTGSGGCNTYSAAYNAGAGALSIGAPVSTQQFCAEPADIMAQEQAYLALLPATSAYEIAGSTLTVRDSLGTVILTYVARRT